MSQFNEVILLKYGEIVLKGLNKSYFENLLLNDIRKRIKKYGQFDVSRAQSTVYIVPKDIAAESNFEMVFNECRKVFGIVSCCRAACVEKSMEKILDTITKYTYEKLEEVKTFKVEAKRSDKQFPYDSPTISKECGSILLRKHPRLKVNVKAPETVVMVEVRDYAAYIHCGSESGEGGLPCGSAGKGLLLLSGGIDSPVAGYRMARRGLTIDALHFESYPYTSLQAKEKVIGLAQIMTDYCGDINLNIISVTHIQEELKNKCREEYFTLLLRRFMMKIAEKTAIRYGCGAIITGESVGQVASQTIPALTVTNNAVKSIPVIRPLIADDKEEIVKYARHIGTFETSILPYEDCCTVFTPKHPVTKPVLENILNEENKLDVETLIADAFETRSHIKLERK